MKVYLIFLFAGIVYAITLPANIDKAKMDDEMTTISGPHYPSMPQPYIIPVDSSTGEYSMWTQMQECLAYNPLFGYLQFVCRNYSLGNNLDVWQNDSTLTNAITDVNVYQAQLGGPRYPTSVADTGSGNSPHISFPYLISGFWGGMGAQYESGGWFSSFWDAPVDVGTGNLGTHKNIGKQLANGNILFIGVDVNDNIHWSTWTPHLDSMLANGIVAPAAAHYWGFDINGGIAYLFYYDDSLNVYYKTTTDGVNWSPTQTYNLVWPNPFPNNVFYWGQVAVTDAGNPILVFDMINGDDAEYPYVGKVYVSTASGQPCTEVGLTTSGAECFYPTIAAGGNYVVVLFGEARSGTGLYTFWDIYYNYSADNGVTWSTPRNLTGSITDHNNCLWQIAKRVDSSGNGQFFFAFGCSISDPLLDLYANIQSGSPTPSRWYVGRNPIVGIAEHKNEAPKKLALNIAPNPVGNQTSITYALPKSGNVSLKLYTADGRLVQTIDQGQRCAGFYTTKIDTRELANGAYVVVLKTDNRMVSGKLVIVH